MTVRLGQIGGVLSSIGAFLLIIALPLNELMFESNGQEKESHGWREFYHVGRVWVLFLSSTLTVSVFTSIICLVPMFSSLEAYVWIALIISSALSFTGAVAVSFTNDHGDHLGNSLIIGFVAIGIFWIASALIAIGTRFEFDC